MQKKLCFSKMMMINNKQCHYYCRPKYSKIKNKMTQKKISNHLNLKVLCLVKVKNRGPWLTMTMRMTIYNQDLKKNKLNCC